MHIQDALSDYSKKLFFPRLHVVDMELKAPLSGESNMGLLYNKEVLAKAGVTLPIKNYEEFIAASKKQIAVVNYGYFAF